MTREEAINKVRQMSLPKETMEILEALAPELKESEDERIRKEMLTFFKNFYETGTWKSISDVNTWLAYLEKQKEQKHPNGCFTCDEYKKGYEEGRRNGFTAGYNNAMKEVEQKEQKPAEWSEEDQKSLNRAINICISDFGEESETARFLKSLPGRFNLQPKVEWSEEDERMLSRCIKSVEYSKQFADSETYKAAKDKEIAWLKSLKPQSHSEWRHYIWAINMRFDYIALIKYDNTDNYEIVQAGNRPKQEKNGVYILIKDIKPQSSWKPSEEQMKYLLMLADSFERVGGTSNAKTLREFHEQLKKLM